MITFDDIARRSHQFYERFSDVPASLIEEVLSGKGSDGIALLKHGKEWAFEPMRELQPRTWKLLISGGDFKMFVRDSWAGSIISVVQPVAGQLIRVHRRFYGFNPSDQTFPVRPYAGERANSLPEAIRLAYYHRIDGLSIPDSDVLEFKGKLHRKEAN